MPGEEIDPKTGKPKEPDDKSGVKPGDKPDETPPDLSKLSDEELDALITKEEAEKEIEFLRKKGLEHLKTLDKLADGYKYLNESDEAAFPIIKELAKAYGVTPVEFAKRLKSTLDKQKPDKKEEPPAKPSGPSEVEIEMGQMQLDSRFLRWKLKMERDDPEVEIPDELQATLEPYIAKILYGLSKEEVNKIDWFGEAHELYLFKLSKAKTPEELEEGLGAHREAMRRKAKQLGIPGSTKSKKLTKEEAEKKQSWGEVDKL